MLLHRAATPDAENALFVDFACPPCRKEYMHWRDDVRATGERYRLSLCDIHEESAMPGE